MIHVSADEVMLRVPARPEYNRIARVGAASVGLRQGMSFAAIDVLRRVIDEAFVLLLHDSEADSDDSDDTELEIVFRLEDGALELQAARCTQARLDEEAVHRFDALTSGLIDDYDLDVTRARLRIRKSAVSEHA